MRTKYEEYLICKERGHISNGVITQYAIVGAESMYRCAKCGCIYWTTTVKTEHEENVPQEGDE